MPKAVRKMLQNGYSYDEPDRMPTNITVKNLDIFMYCVAIIGHFVDLGLDINVAVRYFLAKKTMEFGWTLVFILLPAFVNTAVSVRMYSQDKQQDSVSNEFTKRRWLRIFILVLQMAPILRFTDALILPRYPKSTLFSNNLAESQLAWGMPNAILSLISCCRYSIKSRQAARRRDYASQRAYYGLMLKEDSDAALLRIFECFLEAAPQQVLQTSLLFRAYEHFAVHQTLSICSSVVGMGWCLAAYQRAIRYAQQDKGNMTWPGTVLQTLWHFLVTFSRVLSISIIAFLYPYWTLLACAVHVLVMTTWLQLIDRSPFCSHSKVAELAFSLALGGVYLFTYILPIEGRTRYRYTVYYSICFVQNVTCAAIWYIYVSEEMRASMYFYPVLVLSVVPFVIGLLFMVVYYWCFHPVVSKRVSDIQISFKVSEQNAEIS